jgi:hypothetical protein
VGDEVFGQLVLARIIEPLMVNAFEGNKAETLTMLPTIRSFMDAHRLADVILRLRHQGSADQWGLRHLAGQRRTLHRVRARDSAASSVAFHRCDSVGIPMPWISRLNSPAYTYPYQRFATPSRNVDAWLGAAAGR